MTTATDEQRIAEALERIAAEARPADDGWEQIQRRIRRDKRRRSFRTELLVVAAAATFLVVAGVVVQRQAGGGDLVASGGGRLEFGFEGEPDATLAPPGWDRAGFNTGYEFRSVDDPVHEGERAARIRLVGEPEPGGFGTLMRCETGDDFASKRVRLSGMVATEGASGDGASLWLRADGPANEAVAFDNMLMLDRGLHGDHTYTPVEVVLDIPAEARELCFGFILSGAGTAWADSLVLEVVGELGQGPDVTAENVPGNLDFELGVARDGAALLWDSDGNGYAVVASPDAARTGQLGGSIRYERYTGDAAFARLMQCTPARDYRGRTVVYAGWLRTTNVGAIGGGLWLRVDKGQETIFLDTMEDRPVTGTTDWRRYEIRKTIEQEATEICFGALLSGEGVVDVDDLSLTVE